MTELPRPSSFDLYPKSREPFSLSTFEDPPSEYGGAPLWAWNTELHKPLLRKEIKYLQEMGLGGFTMHPRVGLDTPYLGDEFMDCVKASVAEAKKRGLKAYLYDDDRWPSGYGGGLVTKDREDFRQQHLLFTPWPYGTAGHGPDNNQSSGGQPFRSENGQLIAKYAVRIDYGYARYRRLTDEPENIQPGERVWYAYRETNLLAHWYNDSWYVDTMNPEAMEEFTKQTHERYYKAVGEAFGTTVPAIFTDEPQFATMNRLDKSSDEGDLFMPWTQGLEQSLKTRHGLDLLETLPELFWDTDKLPSLVRWAFHEHTCYLFCKAYVGTLSRWCENHNIALMGHMMEEPTLEQQTHSLGSTMPCYASMQIPGVDMLCDWREYNTVKQCTSVARQYARSAVMSELYGVTNWTFSFKGYLGQGNWQAALGVTLRVHHLSWVSMAGEAKRDYPQQIGYQSPWYKEHTAVELHFKRIGTAMTRGKARTRIAVLHPIESAWLRYGARQTSDLDERDSWFKKLTDTLNFGLLDFDFLSEVLLPEQCGRQVGPCLTVGACNTTLSILKDFVARGGLVLVAGADPQYVDARPSQIGLDVTRVAFDSDAILQALRPYGDMRISTKSGEDSLLYQWRDDGDDNFVFITNTDRDGEREAHVELAGHWHVYELDTITGKEWVLKTVRKCGWTAFDWTFEGCGSLLLRLRLYDQRSNIKGTPQDLPRWQVDHLIEHTRSELSEQNTLLLDYARYHIRRGEEEPQQALPDDWSDLKEILRLDSEVRQVLGFNQKSDGMAQPWTVPKPRPFPQDTLFLQFKFDAKVALSDAELALEGADMNKVYLDGKLIKFPDAILATFWVDESISKLQLPKLEPGTHVIILEVPFDALNTSVERIYLLSFSMGVTIDTSKAAGEKAIITHLLDPSKLPLTGNYTRAGLPFYTGNISYTFKVAAKKKRAGRRLGMRIPKDGLGVNPVVTVSYTARDAKTRHKSVLMQPPYTMEFLGDATHYDVCVTVFGNRDHSFGAVHCPDGRLEYYGPGAWRTNGDDWSDDYTIRPMGLLMGLEVLTSDR
ncbi:hypothetical protein BCR37DRAFT_139835 [Protomyces lactucae-debilis]|uniref:Uncharacterized protein n=1 Tax=Protomyces lactucae-debilis TaxID=2754530 RepID=A0A1Y2FUW2_PROLT|nr:uncharacterized protein BCR37DRAFT_139835 [Protomyces lactucae-debilis]ORY86966.1 hypothetical protein BCR37DRAFT_139835 [Protomyces lactucae-debilis]